MNPDSQQLYLDTLKKALTHSLWPEPPLPLDTFSYARQFPKKQLGAIASWLLKKADLQLVRPRKITPHDIAKGYWSTVADTMVGMEGLNNIQFCMESVLKDGVPGHFIETGVWRGGASIFMRAILAAYGVVDRNVFVADSFCGLPKPDEETFQRDRDDRHWTQEFLAVSRPVVEERFRAYGFWDDQVIFLEGWFKDTLPTVSSEKWALIRLDGDMYESTWQALDCLYPQLSSGGYCIIDDYNILENSRHAVHDYRDKNGIDSPIQETKGNPVYWRKP